MTEAHIKAVEEAAEALQSLALSLRIACEWLSKDPGDGPKGNRVSEILGQIHQVGENAMNDYRVNRKVAKVERHWRAEFEKRENRP